MTREKMIDEAVRRALWGWDWLIPLHSPIQLYALFRRDISDQFRRLVAERAHV